MTEPVVQAELIDLETQRLRARAANKRALLAVWLRLAHGTYDFKLVKSHAIIDAVTDRKERERLILLLRKIRGLIASVGLDPKQPEEVQHE